jgi:hypothetical protein
MARRFFGLALIVAAIVIALVSVIAAAVVATARNTAPRVRTEPLAVSLAHALASTDPYLDIATRSSAAATAFLPVNALGWLPATSAASLPQDVTSAPSLHLPTADRIHSVASSDANDAGVVVLSGSVSSFDAKIRLLVISGAGASGGAAAVSVGDTVLFPSANAHSVVERVDSATQLVVAPLHGGAGAVAAGAAVQIVSSPAGATGARVAHIVSAQTKNGAGRGVAPPPAFVVLNGTAPVPTSAAYFRIERAEVLGPANVGAISFVDTAAGNLATARIPAGAGATAAAALRAPVGGALFVTRFYASLAAGAAAGSSTAAARVDLVTARLTDGPVVRGSVSAHVSAGVQKLEFRPPLRIQEGTDVWLRVSECSEDGVSAIGGIDGLLHHDGAAGSGAAAAV